jgi:hypothetical protein
MHKYGNARHQWLIQNYSPLWFILQKHFSEFLLQYDDSYVREFGYLRSIIPEVVHGYLKCGDLSEGFARVRCPDCHHEFLLAFSCRGRWFRSLVPRLPVPVAMPRKLFSSVCT